MSPTSPWRDYYSTLPNGRCKISVSSLAEFEAKFPHRVLQLPLRGWPEKVVLLDTPLQVGTRVHGSAVPELHLYRIKLRDIPGWPPKFPPRSGSTGSTVPLESRLVKARFVRRKSPSMPRVVLSLDLRERPIKALLTGPPILMLKCIEATLKQAGASGNRLRDLQEIRLVSPDRVPGNP